MKCEDAKSKATRIALSIFYNLGITQKIEDNILSGFVEIPLNKEDLQKAEDAAQWLGYIPHRSEDETAIILKWR